jgi:hypothetical protein
MAKIRRDDAAEGETAEVLLRIEDMDEAKLVLTDDLVIDALRREKAAKRAAKAAKRELRLARHRPKRPADTGE